MTEILPRLAYSGGILELRSSRSHLGPTREFELSGKIEDLDARSSFETEVVEDDIIVRINVLDAMRQKLPPGFNSASDKLIDDISDFTNGGFEDHEDGIFSLEDTRPIGVVYTHFQRWLNASQITEELAKEVITALAYPFAEEHSKRALKQFKYKTDGVSVVAGNHNGMMFSILSRRDGLGLSVQTENSWQVGEVNWNRLELSTQGACACWGKDGGEEVFVEMDSSRLYEIYPHNVDRGVQRLSLILGAGVLANRAAQYTGEENIFADAEWK